MFDIERDLLVEILKEFYKTGITPEQIEKRIYPHCTARTIRNYLNGITKPSRAKYNIILPFLKSEFGVEYNIIKQRIL